MKNGINKKQNQKQKPKEAIVRLDLTIEADRKIKILEIRFCG